MTNSMHPGRLWTDFPLTYFDLETSGLSIDSFVVTACVGDLGASPTEDGVPRQFLLQPPHGREIPEAATAVHGITTEHALTFGTPYEEGLAQIVEALNRAARNGRALTAYNASYDWSLMTAETFAAGMELIRPDLIVDPMVIDKAVAPNLRVQVTDPNTGRTFMRRASRKLVDVAARFGVSLPEEAAHDAMADAVAAGELARVMQQRTAAAPASASPKIREIQALDCAGMMRWQAERRAEQQYELGAWLISTGKADDTDPGWPVTDAVAALVAGGSVVAR